MIARTRDEIKRELETAHSIVKGLERELEATDRHERNVEFATKLEALAAALRTDQLRRVVVSNKTSFLVRDRQDGVAENVVEILFT